MRGDVREGGQAGPGGAGAVPDWPPYAASMPLAHDRARSRQSPSEIPEKVSRCRCPCLPPLVTRVGTRALGRPGTESDSALAFLHRLDRRPILWQRAQRRIKTPEEVLSVRSNHRATIVAVVAVATVLPLGYAVAQTDAPSPSDERVTPSDCPGATAEFEQEGWEPREHIGGPACPSEQEVQALTELCPPDDCHAVDMTSGVQDGGTLGEFLSEAGIAATACPEATAAIRAAGQQVHAYIGRCPTAPEIVELINVSPPVKEMWEHHLAEHRGEAQ